jgi:hypothetical protein
MRFLLVLLALISAPAAAAPLETIGTFCSTFPDQCRKGTQSLLAARGIGTDAYYVIEVDPITGLIPVEAVVTIGAKTYADSARNVYSSTNVTTGAWVEVVAATAHAFTWIAIFDSCGQTLELGAGAALSESRILVIPPGGMYGVPLGVAAGTRLSLRAISASCTTGEFNMTGLE